MATSSASSAELLLRRDVGNQLPAFDVSLAANNSRSASASRMCPDDRYRYQRFKLTRPHELEIVAEAGADTWPVTLSQTLTVGPNTRVEFKRDDGTWVDVELPRERYNELRQRLQLANGQRVHLRPRRITRFGAPVGGQDQPDPAAMI